MKKLLSILIAVMATTALLAFPFFPMTNVVEVTVGDGQSLSNLEQGMVRLLGQYDEDELSILPYPRANSPYGNEATEAMFTTLGASNELSVFFNGQARLYKDHDLLRYGQPIWGDMARGRFTTSPVYISNLAFNGNAISFVLKDAEDEQTLTNLTAYYLIIEVLSDLMGTGVVRYINTETFNITTDGGDQSLSHSLTQAFSGEQYKAIVLIRDANHQILQAASSTRVQKPFRIASEGPLSITDRKSVV
jgi:hypothetical protein